MIVEINQKKLLSKLVNQFIETVFVETKVRITEVKVEWDGTKYSATTTGNRIEAKTGNYDE